LALFRIIESAQGSILIDGVDISTIGLFTLRSMLSIIPQDPVLFNGTVRENLDPFSKATDLELWAALDRVSLKNYVSTLPAQLSFNVVQNGENFSCGQRQLICLARALVRKAKVLVMDEATAAIDVETDSVIQKTIREDMKDCTILTIAHRIGTVIDSDRVLVIGEGRMVEFDTPEELVRRKGVFYKLAKEAGCVE
jgi:ABC-type multidrug transport system fused ATPase/permease subunit